MVSLNVVSTWYHLICKKKNNKREGQERRGEGRGREKERGRKGKKERNLSKQKFSEFPAEFPDGSLSVVLLLCQNANIGSSILFLFSFFS